MIVKPGERSPFCIPENLRVSRARGPNGVIDKIISLVVSSDNSRQLPIIRCRQSLRAPLRKRHTAQCRNPLRRSRAVWSDIWSQAACGCSSPPPTSHRTSPAPLPVSSCCPFPRLVPSNQIAPLLLQQESWLRTPPRFTGVTDFSVRQFRSARPKQPSTCFTILPVAHLQTSANHNISVRPALAWAALRHSGYVPEAARHP